MLYQRQGGVKVKKWTKGQKTWARQGRGRLVGRWFTGTNQNGTREHGTEVGIIGGGQLTLTSEMRASSVLGRMSLPRGRAGYGLGLLYLQ